MTSESRGPFLAVAVLCEKVLEEKDGVLSAIRMVDRIVQTAIGPAAPEEMPPVPVNLTALVCFKSGGGSGPTQPASAARGPVGTEATGDRAAGSL